MRVVIAYHSRRICLEILCFVWAYLLADSVQNLVAVWALAVVDSSRDRGLLTDGGSSHGPPGEVTFRLTAP